MMFGRRRIGRMYRWMYGRISRSSGSRRSIAGKAEPDGMNGDAIETVDDLHFDARLLGERQQKAVGPVEKLAHVGRGELGLGRVVQVQYVVDGRRKRAQAGLDVFDPAAAFACEIRFG